MVTVSRRESNMARVRALSHWKVWLIAGVAAIVAVVVVGPFVYIHFIEGKAPAPLNLSKTTTPKGASQAGATTTTPASSAASSASSAASSAIDGTWNVSSGSTAGYRVQETL